MTHEATLEPRGRLYLRDLGPCDLCKAPLGHDAIYFYRVAVQQFVFDIAACRRAGGLEIMLGNLASIMGADEPLALAPVEKRELNICHRCALSIDTTLGRIIDQEVKSDDGKR